MNPEQLLAHFDRISDAPDAIQRLRRFILDLAVRGKLVEQDPNDEPASELLKRIEAEKERLVQNGKIRKAKPLPPIEQDEMLFQSPAGWEWVRIRQVTSDRGQAIPSTDFTYIDVTAINKEVGCISDAKIVSASDAPSRARKIVRKGDVLYSCVRPYLLNVAIIESEIVPPPIASTAFAVLNGFGMVLSKYLWVALRSSYMIECVETKMRGQAYPAINDSDFALLPFPLCPLAEQHRIVAKVDELMALCDQLESAQNEQKAKTDSLVAASLHHLNEPDSDKAVFKKHASFYINHLLKMTANKEYVKQLRQTILNLAVRGKLVPQDPNDESASELLKRIQLEKAALVKEGAIGKERPLPDIGKEDYPNELPFGWTMVRLGNLTQLVTSGSRDWAKYYSEDGAIFLRMGNLSRNSYQLKLNNIQRVKPPADSEGARTKLESGDILISITGEVGLLGLIPHNFGDAYINQHTCLVRPIRLLSTRYRPELFRSPFAQKQFNKPQRGIKNSFRLTDITQFIVPLPPLAEQRRIVAKVDEFMGLCDKLETQLTTAEADNFRFLEAALHEALATSSTSL